MRTGNIFTYTAGDNTYKFEVETTDKGVVMHTVHVTQETDFSNDADLADCFPNGIAINKWKLPTPNSKTEFAAITTAAQRLIKGFNRNELR